MEEGGTGNGEEQVRSRSTSHPSLLPGHLSTWDPAGLNRKFRIRDNHRSEYRGYSGTPSRPSPGPPLGRPSYGTTGIGQTPVPADNRPYYINRYRYRFGRVRG